MIANINDLINSNGHLEDEGIAFYAEYLSLSKVDELPVELRVHVEECDDCKMRIVGVYEFLTDESQSKDQLFTQSVQPKIKITSYLIKIAAVFVLIAGGYFIFTMLFQNKICHSNLVSNETNGTGLKKEVAKNAGSVNIKIGEEKHENKNKTTNLLANNFVESKDFEELINTGFRNSDEIEVIRPAKSFKFQMKDKLEFQWKSSVEEAFIIKIYSNTGKELVKSKPQKSAKLSIENNLSSGLYYWKLETENDLYYVGKFLVK